MTQKITDTVFLFDVDGTLTPSRQPGTPAMMAHLRFLKREVVTAFVGGSDLKKQREQLDDGILRLFDYSFPENGLSFYKGEQLVSQAKIVDYLGEHTLQRFVNFCMAYLSRVQLPRKRGTFIEMRDSMINVCPIGRSCSTKERKEFAEHDKKTGVRRDMVKALRKEFTESGMHFCIGGQISIDCFPVGWDKRYCLQHLTGKYDERLSGRVSKASSDGDDGGGDSGKASSGDSGGKVDNNNNTSDNTSDNNTSKIKNIYFFGDMVHEGGNDYEIFEDERVCGIAVTSPEDTIKKSLEILMELKKEHGLKD